MKSLILFFSILSTTFAASGSDRMIGYVQQEKPGELVIVSIIQTAKEVVVTVRDFRGEPREARRNVSLREFNEMWNALTSAEAEPFVFVPNEDRSMSEMEYYNFSLRSGLRDTSLRVPRASCPPSLLTAVVMITEQIEKGRRGQPGATDNPDDAQHLREDH